jgi:hypothetical protein
MDVTAIVKVRDDVLHRKGRFLELVMEDVISALYLRLEKAGGIKGKLGPPQTMSTLP